MTKRVRIGEQNGAHIAKRDDGRRVLLAREIDDPTRDADDAPTNGGLGRDGPAVGGPRNLGEGFLRQQAGGRPPGRENTLPRRIKQAIKEALEAHGEDGEGLKGAAGYMFMLARDHKPLFVTLPRRVLPVQLRTEPDPQSLLAKMLEAARARQQAFDEHALTKVIEHKPWKQ